MDVFFFPFRLLIIVFTSIFCLTEADYKCLHKNGLYEDPIQCDKFYDCKDGVAVERLCPDGLVFDSLSRRVNKCDQPFNVDCGDRLELQEPRPSHNCPRQNGYFAHPVENICNVFYNCIDGEATEIMCPSGLHFDELSGTCVWPESANRTGCSQPETIILKDGFSCPKNSSPDHHGQLVIHTIHPHSGDRQKFYVCLNGVTPREQSCPTGKVYNANLSKCDEPEYVPKCRVDGSKPLPKNEDY